MAEISHRLASTARTAVRRWATLRNCKKILVVVHTVTYGTRLREVIRLLESDPRIQVVFTAAPHVFGDGVRELLRGLGGPVLPWREAVDTEFDLALVAGSRGAEQVQAPVVMLAHGASYNKLAPIHPGEPADEPMAVAGLGRRYLTRAGRAIPAALVLSHEEQLAQLAHSCPEALPAARVIGDPTYDRIVASLPQRAEYRAALGLHPTQKLILLASTWGPRSLFGSAESLLPRLLAELPRNDYRLVKMIHPNVWHDHGQWQVRAWLAAYRRQGLGIMPPDADWRSTLIAADWIIGDHGSVTLYGTLTGAPMLLGSFPPEEVDPGSPIAALALTAPALSPSHPVLDQLEYAAAEYRAEHYQRIAARISSEPTRFDLNMRQLIYHMLELGQPAIRPWADPLPPPPRMDS
jgi:hypothetical protein